MKITNMKVWTAAAVSAFLAAGGAAFAQASGPRAERGAGLYGYFSEPKVVRGGTVTALSLDAETGDVSMEVECGSETVAADSRSGVQFVGGRGNRRSCPAQSERGGRPCRSRNRLHREEFHHREVFHDAPECRPFLRPEADGTEYALPDGERPPLRRRGGFPIQIGERVLLIYSADGSTLEAVKSF